MKKRIVERKGKKETYSSKTLKSGELAYYKNGKRINTPYGKRIARGLLAGKTYSQARGHVTLKDKAYSKERLNSEVNAAQNEDGSGFGQWGVPVEKTPKGERHQYYAKVRVTNDSLSQRGSEPSEEGACSAMTMQLYDPTSNDQRGLTYEQVRDRLGPIVRFTVKKYGLQMCTGDIHEDLLGIWRHA